MPGTDAPSTLRPDDAETIRDVATLTGQLAATLAVAAPMLDELREALLRIAPEEAK
jgi:hypothetical protein